MKQDAAPSVSSSTRSTASPSDWPLGSRPSISTVNDTAMGRPTRSAAPTIPMASSTYVIVSADARSAPPAASASSCGVWYASAWDDVIRAEAT